MTPSTGNPPRCFADMRNFAEELERRQLLRRVSRPVSIVHEMTEIHRRVLLAQGPALLFEQPLDREGLPSPIPVLTNLFGTEERIALGLGIRPDELGALGEMLAFLRQPTPPDGMMAALAALPSLQAALAMGTRMVRRAPAQARRWLGEEIDLAQLPIQWCWPGEPAPLITWPLVITRAPDDPKDVNVGIYRMQVAGPRQLIVRWLAHRGGARHHRMWAARSEAMPIAVAIGADPATILAAVMPLPRG